MKPWVRGDCCIQLLTENKEKIFKAARKTGHLQRSNTKTDRKYGVRKQWNNILRVLTEITANL